MTVVLTHLFKLLSFFINIVIINYLSSSDVILMLITLDGEVRNVTREVTP